MQDDIPVVAGQITSVSDPAVGARPTAGRRVAFRDAALLPHVADLSLTCAVAEHAGVEVGRLPSVHGYGRHSRRISGGSNGAFRGLPRPCTPDPTSIFFAHHRTPTHTECLSRQRWARWTGWARCSGSPLVPLMSPPQAHLPHSHHLQTPQLLHQWRHWHHPAFRRCMPASPRQFVSGLGPSTENRHQTSLRPLMISDSLHSVTHRAGFLLTCGTAGAALA